jgi:5-methylcytosine-specific restriction endonuclease McrA
MTKTPYSEGFIAGIRYQRDNILEFIEIHKDQNVPITVDDIADEINHQHKKDLEVELQERGLTWGLKN